MPIGDYALLSDCRTATLVSRTGSVDRLCFPRFDGPAVFTRLLDDDAGHFAVRVPGAATSRRYLDQTMALETTFRSAGGTAVLADALAVGRNDRGHELGAGSPRVLLRRVAVHRRRGRGGGQHAPRPEYGLVHPLLEPVDGGTAARGGADRLLLSAPAGFVVDGATAGARLRLRAGESAGFALHHAWAIDQAARRQPAAG
ncbi:MAG TPA: trehalase-like domain-containing protein [Actinomycetes bacterium]|nr:trehalase-like domain-containing protein [Actinomycetes bacterium]